MPMHSSYGSASGISAMMRFNADRRIAQRKGHNGTRRPAGSHANGREPTIDELLDDPIVQALMARDNVSARDIRRLLGLAPARGNGHDDA